MLQAFLKNLLMVAAMNRHDHYCFISHFINPLEASDLNLC